MVLTSFCSIEDFNEISDNFNKKVKDSKSNLKLVWGKIITVKNNLVDNIVTNFSYLLDQIDDSSEIDVNEFEIYHKMDTYNKRYHGYHTQSLNIQKCHYLDKNIIIVRHLVMLSELKEKMRSDTDWETIDDIL